MKTTKEFTKPELPKIKYYPTYKVVLRNKDKQAHIKVILHKFN